MRDPLTSRAGFPLPPFVLEIQPGEAQSGKLRFLPASAWGLHLGMGTSSTLAASGWESPEKISGHQATAAQMMPLCKVEEVLFPGSMEFEPPHASVAGFLHPFPHMQKTWGYERPPDFGWGHKQAWGSTGGLAVLIPEERMVSPCFLC